MYRKSKWFHCSALAVASAAMLALPSAASAHETGDHTPITAACPPGGPIQNAICTSLRGLEHSVRAGGTVGTAQEFAAATQQNALGYKNTTVANVGAFTTTIDFAVADLGDASIAGVFNAVLESDLYGAGLIQSVEAALLAPFPVPQCPMNGVSSPALQNTVQALKVFFCAQWAAVFAALPGDLTPLADHIDQLAPTLGDIEEPVGDALDVFGEAVADASIDLTEATNAATQALGAKQVLDAFYAVQCVRKGDYGSQARPTPCPL